MQHTPTPGNAQRATFAGIPDFDTAHGRGGQEADEFRASLYANPSYMIGPLEIVSPLVTLAIRAWPWTCLDPAPIATHRMLIVHGMGGIGFNMYAFYN